MTAVNACLQSMGGKLWVGSGHCPSSPMSTSPPAMEIKGLWDFIPYLLGRGMQQPGFPGPQGFPAGRSPGVTLSRRSFAACLHHLERPQVAPAAGPTGVWTAQTCCERSLAGEARRVGAGSETPSRHSLQRCQGLCQQACQAPAPGVGSRVLGGYGRESRSPGCSQSNSESIASRGHRALHVGHRVGTPGLCCARSCHVTWHG